MTDFSAFIEHTILAANTSLTDVKRVCEEAKKYKFAGVCIPPIFVREARRIIGDESKIRVATVVGFPMGYNAIAAKSEEIKRAVDEGADEIDAMINLAALKSDNWNHVEHDIDSIARATHMRGRTLKLILECGVLNQTDIKRLADLAQSYKVTWLVTGTGHHGYHATAEMVRSLKSIAPGGIKIKAAGGIEKPEIVQKLVEAGADRIGTSMAMQIIGAKN